MRFTLRSCDELADRLLHIAQLTSIEAAQYGERQRTDLGRDFSDRAARARFDLLRQAWGNIGA